MRAEDLDGGRRNSSSGETTRAAFSCAKYQRVRLQGGRHSYHRSSHRINHFLLRRQADRGHYPLLDDQFRHGAKSLSSTRESHTDRH
jgi:hypothetical protein